MCLALGLTGIHDAGIAPAEIDVYRRLAENGKLKIRVYVMVEGRRAPEYFAKHGLLIGDRLTVRAAKAYADGALGSRGALLLAPYADRPTDEHGQPYTGLAVDPELVRQLAEDGLRQGYQVCTHAIGDRGNRDTLDAYAAALAKAAQTTAASAPAGAPRPDPRFRIEHAQVLAPEDIPRFATLGVIAAMQPTHCTSDMRWVDDRLGPARSAGAYAWASLLRSGVRVAGGSDFPVESPNPMLGIYAAVTRQDQEGCAGRRLASTGANDARGSAAGIHARRGVCGFSGGVQGRAGGGETGRLHRGGPGHHDVRAARDQRRACTTDSHWRGRSLSDECRRPAGRERGRQDRG